MKYFTPKHYPRGNSTNDIDARGIEEEWERALRGYRRHWNRIRHAFPKTVHRFMAENICLHEAHVLSITSDHKKLVMVLQMEPPSRELVMLSFTLSGDLEIDQAALPNRGESPIVAWLYEEWDLDPRGACWFEVLLSNGWALKLPFREFRYSISEQQLPFCNGQKQSSPRRRRLIRPGDRNESAN
jgi:hypothetical protein